MAWRQALRAVGVLAVALVVSSGPSAAIAADTVAFTITDKRVTSSSGLVRDPVANIYWTVNDSGDTGTAYGITPKGKVAGTLDFRGTPKDVEAVAMGKDRLYVADIGDNAEKRDDITVYYFNNPRANGLTVTYKSWDFRYPDGAHDAETLLVDSTGRLFIVTKDKSGAIYAAPKKPEADGVNKLSRVGEAPDTVTDGVFLPGDQQIALLRKAGVVEVVDAKTYAKVSTVTVPKQPQPESLALSLDGTSLLIGSEGKKSKVYAVPLPGTETASPSPGATGDSDSGQADVPEDDDANSGQGRRGTFLAIGLAAFAAIVAGAVVAFARKP